MTAPSGRPRVGQIVTPHRVVYTLALACAAVLMIVGFQVSKDQRAAGCSAGPIVKLIPCPGDSDLRQGLIGAALTGGFKAALIVDRTPIPDDQLRTGGVNQIYFQPGAGTETGALAPGIHSATVLYWPITGTREQNAKSFVWQFGVT